MHLTKTNKKIVILPCRGIGDALLMLIAAERLQAEGYEVVTVHPKIPELQGWFPHLTLKAEWLFTGDEWIIAENDNSERIGLLKKDHRPQLSIFYPTYLATKHGELSPLDRVFDSHKSMAENIAIATASLLKLPEPIKHNGITPPSHLKHRHRHNRVLIHDTSSAPEKNWLKDKFHEVAVGLRQRGFDPIFVQPCDTLSDLAAYIYESGFVIGNDSLVGHLASNLQIPTVIIADKSDRMKLWRPGWLEGSVITLNRWVPSWKFFEKNWQYFISSHRVLRSFDNLSRLF